MEVKAYNHGFYNKVTKEKKPLRLELVQLTTERMTLIIENWEETQSTLKSYVDNLKQY